MWMDRKLCQSIFQGTEICSLSTDPFSWHCPELDCNLLHHSQRVYDYKKAYLENPGFRKMESLPLLNFISTLWYVSMIVDMLVCYACLREGQWIPYPEYSGNIIFQCRVKPEMPVLRCPSWRCWPENARLSFFAPTRCCRWVKITG